MPDGGVFLGLLLVASAVALAAIFGIAAGAAALVRSRRRSAVTGPFVAALIAGVLLLLDGPRLGFDLVSSTLIVALVALGVAVPQRLEEARPSSAWWRLGKIGTEAWIGAAQGIFFGALATWITRDWRFTLLMLPIGAAIRGIWIAIERPRTGLSSDAVATVSAGSARPGLNAVLRPPVPAASISQSRVASREPKAGYQADPSLDPAGAGQADGIATKGGGTNGTVKLVVGTIIVLVVGAGIAFATSSTGYHGPHLVAVYNRTTTPIVFADELFGRGAFVAPCATRTFDLDSRYRSPSASPVPAVPANAVTVKLPITYGAAEFGPPPAQSIIVLNDGETVDSSGASPRALEPCAGAARQKVELAGDGDFTSEPIRLAGFYSEQISVYAPAATGCDFGATVSNPANAVELAKAFTVPPGGHPIISDSRSYPDASYQVAVRSGCSWRISIEP